jgi:hypothetical protein
MYIVSCNPIALSQAVGFDVTAAYATITSRLGVVVTRLLAAAFWLGVVKEMLLPS